MFDFEVRLVLAPDHPLASKNADYGRFSQRNAVDLPAQRKADRDVWRHFLQPAGVSPLLKSVIIRYC